MTAVVIAAPLAFVLALIGSPFVIAGLRRLRAAQPIRGVYVEAHQVKRGTPTMGGLIFIGATLVAYFIGHLAEKALPSQQIVPPRPTITGLVLLGLMVFCGAIGFIDDLLKVSRRNTAGLSGRWKIVLQIVVGGVFGTVAVHFPSTSGQTVASDHLSFIRDISWARLGSVLIVIVFIGIVMASTNAVNLTDGLDGLATGTSVIVLIAYVAISFWQYRHWCSDTTHLAYCYQARDPLETGLIASAAAGALTGYLWWGTWPARVFMGDVGSMSIGGLIAGEAVATHTILLLPVIGVLFVIITGSRIIQYVSWKTRHKRVFRQSPLHHHFEQVGWSEVNIVIRFWIIAGIGTFIGLALFYSAFLAQTG
ncbi:phospho-N-acetylmuramoyl-pentapeptide-transferase [Rugosimonospora africana]|uniref:Phospho-N-acetylmuramoyl-pentapeptide-transferase n=1 Tax=Rugosimonospora africana TaxID=556532 RepID=A0A8J3QVM2_9ACTN|nr:phospho-N-acetylmuramoyl-pentapeptide-transferase [Rugosimonospora africana]GIH16655.1 phospho-N-acetylmuramoyl-pentapeptide-transferase [Rugosimonospora africana]